MEKMGNVYTILEGKPKGKRQFWRLGHRLDNIRMNPEETGCVRLG